MRCSLPVNQTTISWQVCVDISRREKEREKGRGGEREGGGREGGGRERGREKERLSNHVYKRDLNHTIQCNYLVY